MGLPAAAGAFDAATTGVSGSIILLETKAYLDADAAPDAQGLGDPGDLRVGLHLDAELACRSKRGAGAVSRRQCDRDRRQWFGLGGALSAAQRVHK